MRMLFGSYITIDRGLLVDWDPDRPVFENASHYMQSLDNQLQAVLEASMAHRALVYASKRTGPPPGQIRTFAPGDLFWPTTPTVRLTKPVSHAMVPTLLPSAMVIPTL